ncbi:MAG: hypothetical protein WCK31_04775, partial [bacterium]
GYNTGKTLTTGVGNVFIGAYAGMYQTTAVAGSSNLLIIDGLDRGAIGNEPINSLIYGVFNATSSSQKLNLNALVFIKHDLEQTRGNYQYHRQTLNQDTNGDWRTYADANGFYVQKRVSGAYITIQEILA